MMIRKTLQAVASFADVFLSLWGKDIMDKTFQISFEDMLAAYRNHPYSQDEIVLLRVLHGPTDASVFGVSIKELLQRFGRWPEPKSVLAMHRVFASETT